MAYCGYITRLKNVIYNEENISYSEIFFLQDHQDEVLQYGDVRLAEWAGIPESVWNNR